MKNINLYFETQSNLVTSLLVINIQTNFANLIIPLGKYFHLQLHITM